MQQEVWNDLNMSTLTMSTLNTLSVSTLNTLSVSTLNTLSVSTLNVHNATGVFDDVCCCVLVRCFLAGAIGCAVGALMLATDGCIAFMWATDGFIEPSRRCKVAQALVGACAGSLVGFILATATARNWRSCSTSPGALCASYYYDLFWAYYYDGAPEEMALGLFFGCLVYLFVWTLVYVRWRMDTMSQALDGLVGGPRRRANAFQPDMFAEAPYDLDGVRGANDDVVRGGFQGAIGGASDGLRGAIGASDSNESTATTLPTAPTSRAALLYIARTVKFDRYFAGAATAQLMSESADAEPIVQALVWETQQYLQELQEGAPPGFSPPASFCCPITLAIMSDPVRTKYDHVFEREALELWILKCACCPVTRQPLCATDVAPAPDIMAAIIEWILSKEQEKMEQEMETLNQKKQDAIALVRRNRNARNRQKRALAKATAKAKAIAKAEAEAEAEATAQAKAKAKAKRFKRQKKSR